MTAKRKPPHVLSVEEKTFKAWYPIDRVLTFKANQTLGDLSKFFVRKYVRSEK